MVLLVRFFLPLILCCSCAKMGYLYNQGMGQWDLFRNARENEELLRDPSISSEIKEKIKKVETYKAFFFEYWQTKNNDIYSRTYFLKGSAVTHLLIASKYDEVKAKEECFFLAGCFPYLGFFKEGEARSWAKNLEDHGHFTFIRPVYAYSTLGHFSDPILSSFFYFDDLNLAELIFHELFHTIFFIKDEVQLNENLANYIGKEMAINYFKLGAGEILKMREKELRGKGLRQFLTEKVRDYQLHLNKRTPKSKEEAQDRLEKYIELSFIPEIRAYCDSHNIPGEECFPLKRKWNNASFAAYLTYENDIEKIELLGQGRSLIEFHDFIKSEYEKYKENSSLPSFSQYLFRIK